MSTVTTFAQLKAYWWNSSDPKKDTVKINLRDLRPRNSYMDQCNILTKLLVARAAKEKRLIKYSELEEITGLTGIAPHVDSSLMEDEPLMKYLGLLGQPEIVRAA